MAIGERIHYLRNLRGMTQKALGLLMNFPENAADVRIAQYESGARTPKIESIIKMADILDVSPRALDVPNIDTYLDVMHTFFALQDMYGFEPVDIDGYTHIRIGSSVGMSLSHLMPMLNAWLTMTTRYKNQEITKEEYDQWRYRYPQIDYRTEEQKKYTISLSEVLAEAIRLREEELQKKKRKKK